MVVSSPDRCGHDADGEVPIESWLGVAVMKAVAQHRNVRPQWDWVPDSAMTDFGNGSYAGALGTLQREAELVLGPMAITLGRMRHLRPTVPFLQVGTLALKRVRKSTQRKLGEISLLACKDLVKLQFDVTNANADKK